MRTNSTFAPDVSNHDTKKYKGIYIPHRVLDAKSKNKASKSLKDWVPIELTAPQWIERLTLGQTIQPSTFNPRTDGSFTHAIDAWKETYFVCADADHIKSVEYNDDGTDKNASGVTPFTDSSQLFAVAPFIHDKVYAITESVSSMSYDKPPPHRRYRLIFLFDEPITTPEHYHEILIAFSGMYPIIPPERRSPAQPVFGNAREKTSQSHLFGNILRLSDFPLPKQKKPKASQPTKQGNKAFTGEADLEALNYVPNDCAYEIWRSIGMAIKDAGFGVDVFEKWSGGQRKNSSGEWVNEDIQAHWSRYKRTSGNLATWGTVVHIATQHGYTPQHRSNTPKLSKTAHTAEPEPESITLAESEILRTASAQAFIEKPCDSDLLQIQTVQDDTGTGKTTTALIITAKAKQKTVALAETVPLAHQLETDAMDKGFVNTITLQSRKTGWKDMDDDAEPEFGEVLCRMYPKTKELNNLRLPARFHCETACPYLKECKEDWYLSQFKDIDQRDFVATATPNIFFDLHFRGFLKTLTERGEMTDDDSDMSLAFDAMTDSKVKRESTDDGESDNFDVGIIDDYTISSLFTDVVWTEKELERVKEAWQGTPTARFVGKVLKALKKRKPQKIMKALRKAYNQTAEDHKEIADTLTQHARHGTIISASLPKLSELAHNAVEYTDGGKQFIPVEDYQPSHEQVMALAENLPSVEEKPLDESIKKSGAYSDVRLERIRTDYARRRLNAESIPCVPTSLDAKDLQPGEKVIVPHPFNEALAAGVKLRDLTPVWQNGCTPIDLLKILLGYVKQDKNAPVNIRYKLSKETEKPTSVLSFSIPPQAPVGIIKKLIMLSATVDTDDLEKVFTGQPTEIDKHIGKRIKLANDVGICQFADARITSGSVFEYNTDENGNRIKKPAGLTKKARERLAKLNDYANQVDGLTVFISYKDLAEDFRAHLDNFDEVSSFDKVAGLNFNGLKLLVVFGYPKVSHEVVMAEARKQYANDTDPLPRGEKELYDENGNLVSEYIQLTEECEYNDDGLVIKERRYKNHRLEKIRIQLSADKLRQCVGRARLVRWTGTLSLIFTNTPLPGITDRAELFGNDAFNAAESASDLPAAQKRITDAIESGDVKAVMEATGKSESTARRKTKETRDQKNAERDAEIIRLHEKGISQRKIHTEMQASEHKVSFGTVGNVIKAYKNSHSLKVTLKGDDRICTPNEKPDDTSVPSVLPEKYAAAAEQRGGEPEPQNSDPKPIPLSEYSLLDAETALLELERCNRRSNYSGAALLRNLLRKRCVSDKQPVEKVNTEEPMLNLFDWDTETLYLRREEIENHLDVSKLIPKDSRLRNLADDELLRVDSENNEIISFSVVDKSYVSIFHTGHSLGSSPVSMPCGFSGHDQDST